MNPLPVEYPEGLALFLETNVVAQGLTSLQDKLTLFPHILAAWQVVTRDAKQQCQAQAEEYIARKQPILLILLGEPIGPQDFSSDSGCTLSEAATEVEDDGDVDKYRDKEKQGEGGESDGDGDEDAGYDSSDSDLYENGPADSSSEVVSLHSGEDSDYESTSSIDEESQGDVSDVGSDAISNTSSPAVIQRSLPSFTAAFGQLSVCDLLIPIQGLSATTQSQLPSFFTMDSLCARVKVHTENTTVPADIEQHPLKLEVNCAFSLAPAESDESESHSSDAPYGYGHEEGNIIFQLVLGVISADVFTFSISTAFAF